MQDLLKKIENIGIVPVIKIDNAEDAVPLGKALAKGGIPVAEVTFRTAAGEEAIRRMSAECPEILVGAGTVLNIEQCDRALAAGAKFIVCPGYDEALVAYCQQKNVLILPGCACPSDVSKAYNAGLEVIKFFPAEQSGGINFLKAIAPVYPKLRFMPTGGISAGNLNSYLSFDKIIACGGSWMVKADMIADGQFDEIAALCDQAIRAMLGFELVHVGINAENEAEAMSSAKMLETLFGFAIKDGNSSIFASNGIEIMKQPYLGKNGHIAIGTYDVDRAKAYLENRGFAFNEESAKTKPNGKLAAIYMKDEICNFAFHLVAKN